MRSNLIIHVASVVNIVAHNGREVDGEWIPCRPEGFASLRYRIKAAWLVFTGRADALIWPGNQ